MSVDDAAEDLLAGGQSITEVVLRPRIAWATGHAPTADQLAALHERAHHECFISRSMKCAIRVEAAEG